MAEKSNYTVRDVIKALADCTDPDAEVCFSFNNSDPIPVTEVEENEEGQVVLSFSSK